MKRAARPAGAAKKLNPSPRKLLANNNCPAAPFPGGTVNSENAIIPPGLLCGDYEIEFVQKSLHGIPFYSGEHVRRKSASFPARTRRKAHGARNLPQEIYDEMAYQKFISPFNQTEHYGMREHGRPDEDRTALQQFLDLEALADEE